MGLSSLHKLWQTFCFVFNAAQCTHAWPLRIRTRTLPPWPWLTCVPQLLVAIHGKDDQEVAQDVNNDGEDEKAPQSRCNPRWPVQDGVSGASRGAVQLRLIHKHCTPWQKFLNRSKVNSPKDWISETPVLGDFCLPWFSSSSFPRALLLLFLPLCGLLPAAVDQLRSSPLLSARLGVTYVPLCHQPCWSACVTRSSNFKPSQHVIEQTGEQRLYLEGEILTPGGTQVEWPGKRPTPIQLIHLSRPLLSFGKSCWNNNKVIYM